MANAKIIEQKAQRVNEIADMIKKAQTIVFFDYRGMTVAEADALRNDMRKGNIEYVVLKNGLVRRAAIAAGIDESVCEYLKGPSAFAFSYEDVTAPARILKDFVKKHKKCELKGGIVEGKVQNAEQINALADLPSREVLIARLLGSMMSPISGLAIALDQVAKKLSEQENQA